MDDFLLSVIVIGVFCRPVERTEPRCLYSYRVAYGVKNGGHVLLAYVRVVENSATIL